MAGRGIADRAGRFVLPLLTALLTACTSTTLTLPPASVIDARQGYRPGNLHRTPGEEPALPGRYVVLTFSGGGTRATALAHGVLRELGATPGQTPGTTLLDAVDMVSSTSGGSVAAANFALQGPENYGQLHGPGGFLSHDGMTDLAGQLLNPINAAAFALTPRSRIEVLPEMLRRQAGFGDATFADLLDPSRLRRPLLLLNAADMQTGLRFTFTQSLLDRLCLDLTTIRIADAVAASAAFPVALTPMPLPVRSPCEAQARERQGGLGLMEGYDEEARIGEQRSALRVACDGTAGGGGRDVLFARDPSQLPRALRQWHYLNLDVCGQPLPRSQRVQLVHLLDGGTADNLGLAAPLEVITGGIPARPLQLALRQGRVREIVLIMVNARSQGDVPRFWSAFTPGIIEMLSASIGTPIDERSSGLIAQAGSLEAVLGPRYPGLKVRLIPVNFERIADPECRQSFQGIGTNWALPAHEIDALQEMASAMLRADTKFLGLPGVGTAPAIGQRRAVAACERLRDRAGPAPVFGAAATVR